VIEGDRLDVSLGDGLGDFPKFELGWQAGVFSRLSTLHKITRLLHLGWCSWMVSWTVS